MSARLQLRDIFEEDLDKLFSYKTPMLVIIKDRYLGLLKLAINLGIFIYFLVYVIIIQKAYLLQEYSVGTAIVYASGTAVTIEGSTVRVWDAVDVAYPQYDPSAIVISTEVMEQIRQQKGICIDEERRCVGDSDCLAGGTCVGGLCEEISWCSPQAKKNYVLDGVENFIIWFQGNIDFITMAPGVDFTNIDKSDAVVYPDGGANSYLLSDILKLGDLKYEDLKATGAVIRIKLKWDCHITWSNSCTPTVVSERLDGVSGKPLGFRYDRYFYYKDQGLEYRDHLNVTGIKIQVESSGRAYAVTINSIIINLSSAINLTMITPRIVDFLMLYVMSKREDYRKAKFAMTKDLNAETTAASGNDLQTSQENGRIKPEENHFRN